MALAFSSTAVDASPSSLDGTWGDGGRATPTKGRIVTKVASQPDGSTIAVVENWGAMPEEGSVAYVVRLLPDGAVDGAFSGGALSFACNIASNACALRVAVDAQGRISIASSVASPDWPYEIQSLEIRRFAASGAPDVAFGTAGTLQLRGAEYCPGGTCGFRLYALASITALANGRVLLATGCLTGAGFDVDATCAMSVGSTGTLDWVRPIPRFLAGFTAASVAPLPDGSAILGGRTITGDASSPVSRAALHKILAGGSADPEFNGGSLLLFPYDGARLVEQVAPTPDGSVVVLLSGNFGYSLTKRFDRVTTRSALEGSWGVAALQATSFKPAAFAIASDASVVAVGTIANQATVMRLRPDGSADTKFAGQGIASFPFKGGSQATTVAVRSDGRIVVGGASYVGNLLVPAPKPSFPPHNEPIPSPLVFQLQGGVAAADYAWREVAAVEYFHPQFDHYFVTTNGDEMQGLDLADPAPWMRTGKRFNVAYPYSTGLSSVCRFWSGQSFVPKSSHFYTPYASEECSPLKSSSVWTYEGDVFSLKLPEGLPGAKGCPAGMQPLYRAYNNGQGGAPNHRYTIDASVLDAMSAKGWTVEGDGVTRVFACTPAE